MSNYVLNSNMIYYLLITDANSLYNKKSDYLVYYNDA